MALHCELQSDPEAVEIIESALIAGKKTKAINALLEAAGKATTTKQNIHQSWMKRQSVIEGIRANQERLMRRRYGDRCKRVKVLEGLVDRMLRVINEREAAMVDSAPGGASGLLTEDVKNVGGMYGREVSVYRADTALIKEVRETLKQVAMEVGDWTEKREVSGPDGGAIPIQFVDALNKVYGDDPDDDD